MMIVTPKAFHIIAWGIPACRDTPGTAQFSSSILKGLHKPVLVQLLRSRRACLLSTWGIPTSRETPGYGVQPLRGSSAAAMCRYLWIAGRGTRQAVNRGHSKHL